MQTIHRYSFTIDDDVALDMPQDARILDVQIGREGPTLWAMVDTDAPLVKRRIEVYGTGRSLDPLVFFGYRKYIGTIQEHNGALVWHLFDQGEAP